jgi:hypothetical protein
MNAVKCANCGFIGFPERSCCKRCGQALLSLTLGRAHRVDNSAERNLRRFLMIIAGLAVLGVIVAGVVIVRAKLKPDPNLAYIEAINKSSQFKEPVTVRVNQEAIPSGFGRVILFEGTREVLVWKSAFVLQDLGLLRISMATSYKTVEGINSELELKAERVDISLTEKGHEEAVNWWTTEETGKFPGSTKYRWWRIPIGDREITRIEWSREADPNTVYATVRWRWRPNKLGENFDCGGVLVKSLSKEAKEGALSHQAVVPTHRHCGSRSCRARYRLKD